jgi:hypothetical protein
MLQQASTVTGRLAKLANIVLAGRISIAEWLRRVILRTEGRVTRREDGVECVDGNESECASRKGEVVHLCSQPMEVPSERAAL